MVRTFRKYHRSLAIIMALPLGLTILTGLGYTIFEDWLHLDGVGEFLIGLHTGELVGLEDIYPVLNGLGAIGLVITGIVMSGLTKSRRKSPASQPIE
ncbi:MAG: peptidase [Leptolyngbya sp.]|nr:MAG: peptidase [Leptolyngbya sp.]